MWKESLQRNNSTLKDKKIDDSIEASFPPSIRRPERLDRSRAAKGTNARNDTSQTKAMI